MKKAITRDDIDLARYDMKFQRVDMYLSKGGSEQVLKSILDDPSTFAYMMFKVDGKPLKVYPYQDIILNDPSRFIYNRSSNQTGKSMTFVVKASRNLLIDHNKAHNEAIVSRNLPLSSFQMRRIKSILNSMDKISWKETKGETDNMSVLSVDIKDYEGRVKYTNQLILAPCSEGLLSYDLHELNLDEFEFWDADLKYFYYQIALPRTFHTKGRIFITTNPNGQDNFGAELELNPEYKVYIFNYLDKPGNTKEEYDALEQSMPRSEFESTVAAVRTISNKNYFTPDEIERSLDKDLTELKMVGRQPFFFLDVGSKHDQSVLCGGFVEIDEDTKGSPRPIKHVYVPIIHVYPIGYPISRVVGSYDEDQDSDGWHHEKSVKEHLVEWTFNEKGEKSVQPMFGCDVTGNSGIIPLFKSVNINPIDVTFSGKEKSGMYQRFKYFMEKGLLHRVSSKEFDYQARHMIVKKSARGYLLIHHESEDDLDDVMDATAGLIYLADNPKVVPVTCTVI